MADFQTVFNKEIFEKEYGKANHIDYFFTTRKTFETKEIVNSDLSRKTEKVGTINNFIVFNLNLNNILKTDEIHVEIWGDKGYFYQGKMINNMGFFPLFSLKLKKDTQIFLKLFIKKKEEDNENYVNFITIPKKYQEIENV
jgi:hypothetical protein